MSRRRTYAIIVVAGLLTAALDLLMHLIPESPGAKPWLEHQSWYSAKILLLAVTCLIVAIVAVELWRHRSADNSERSTESSRYSLGPAVRLQLLDKVQRERVNPRLRQGLREAIRVDLDLTETPNAVKSKLRAYVASESAASRDRSMEGSVEGFFKEVAGGRLLILGEPGTGKTNLLLELAGSLISDAKRNETLPIPVVFNLPRWALGKRTPTLDEWLIDDLHAEYGLSRATADELITRNRILPLLDGLDEVSEQRRAACVTAINAFQQGRDLACLVVCCRTDEHASLPKLELGTAVRVEKLARSDIERQIAGSRMKRVRQLLESDPKLWQVIDTPLWLHVIYCASLVNSPLGTENGDPRDKLYARFIEYALGREPDGSPRRRTAREPLLRWIGWLAAEMRSRDQSQIAFEDLDWSWLPSKSSQRCARWLAHAFAGLVVGLDFGIVFVPLGWLVARPSVGLVFGFGVGLGVALVFGPIEALFWTGRDKFPAAEELYFSWRVSRAELVGMLMAVLISGLVSGLVGGLVSGFVGGLTVSLMLGLSVSLVPRPVSEHSAPNRATLRSLRYALVVLLSSGILAFVLMVTFTRFILTLSARPSFFGGTGIIRFALPAAISVGGWLIALQKGGSFALRHYGTRVSLWWCRLAPLRYVRFLNEVTERLFLIRHGGSYEFLHLTFRDYMAGAHGPRPYHTRQAN